MLSPTATTVRLFLHVLAASIWVGGQFVLGSAVPAVRRAAPTATPVLARAFARIAWPAFAVVAVTGVWNLVEVDITQTDAAYQATIFLKLALAVASAVFAAVHAAGRSTRTIAIGGALGGLTALGALFVGVMLRTGA